MGKRHRRRRGEQRQGTGSSQDGTSTRAGAPPRGPANSGRNGESARVLQRVRALLAKAESTTFPEEAEAFTAKAQELISRHSIDQAMLDAAAAAADSGSPGGASRPVGFRIPVDNPYASPKSLLLAQVAAANNCRSVWDRREGHSTVFGFHTDLESVELLYTSLLVQGTAAMVAAGPQVDWRGRSRTRSFRHSFLVAYAFRIGERLREARSAGRAAATEVYGEAALVPVLAGRTEAVAAALRAVFPTTTPHLAQVSNAAGLRAGRAAADLAWLSTRREMPADVA